MPRSNVGFWTSKLNRNVERDSQAVEELDATGWRVLVIWECELKETRVLAQKISQFLGPLRQQGSPSSQPKGDR